MSGQDDGPKQGLGHVSGHETEIGGHLKGWPRPCRSPSVCQLRPNDDDDNDDDANDFE